MMKATGDRIHVQYFMSYGRINQETFENMVELTQSPRKKTTVIIIGFHSNS